MAYASGHNSPERGLRVWDETPPPDYGADTPSDRGHPRTDMEFYGNGRLPDQHETHPGNVDGYHEYGREPGVYANLGSDLSRSSHYSPRDQNHLHPFTSEHAPPDLEMMDAGGRGRHPPIGADNLAFSFDETDLGVALRQRYLPKKRWKRDRKPSMRNQMDDGDNDSVETLDLINPEDLRRTKDLVATICIRQRTRRSVKRSADQQEDEEGRGREEDYEEVKGLPSSRAQRRIKPLAERLKELHKTNAETARSPRERYADFDPSLVASAAWKGWEKRKAQIADVLNQLDVWSSHFKEIEGRFGNATASYFRFMRWLLVLNFYTFLVAFLVIVVPFFSSTTPSTFIEGLSIDNHQPASNGTDFIYEAFLCSETYSGKIENVTENEQVHEQVLDFFVGTGWMEETSMFYGYYHNRTFNTGGNEYNYNMGLAYMMAMIVTFLISFVLILMNSSHSVKDTVTDNQEQSSVHFTNSVLCSWDYCISEEKTAKSRKSIIFQEFKADLQEQSKRLQRQNRTSRQNLVLVILRVVINVVVICILGGSLFLIYFTTNALIDLRNKTDDQVLLLIIQLLPSLTITALNFIVPLIFNGLVSLEDYWPAFELKITLIRTVFVRLSSLGVLTFSLYYTLLWPGSRQEFYCDEENNTDTKCCGNYLWEGQQNNETNITSSATSTVQCWETYVGQQFYKLTLVDFAALIIVTFFVEFPRKLIYNQFKESFNLVKKYGSQEFDIPRNVLDIVYSQALSWLGTFFCPWLPLITLLKVFVIFYIKKLTLMKNFAPPQHVYKVSKSNSFFNIMLLISMLLVAMIIGYMIGTINPSKSCGPFRLYSQGNYVSWVAVTDVIAGWPDWASKLFFFFGTTAFFVPCFILLCLLMYYYWAVGQGYKRKEEILQEQLKLEGKDKQFLLARVNYISKQGNLQGITAGMP